MSDLYEASVLVELTDQQALYRAALERATEEGLSAEEADEMLIDDDGINIGACLQMVFDPGQSWPGTQILDSSAERCPV